MYEETMTILPLLAKLGKSYLINLIVDIVLVVIVLYATSYEGTTYP